MVDSGKAHRQQIYRETTGWTVSRVLISMNPQLVPRIKSWYTRRQTFVSAFSFRAGSGHPKRTTPFETKSVMFLQQPVARCLLRHTTVAEPASSGSQNKLSPQPRTLSASAPATDEDLPPAATTTLAHPLPSTGNVRRPLTLPYGSFPCRRRLPLSSSSLR